MITNTTHENLKFFRIVKNNFRYVFYAFYLSSFFGLEVFMGCKIFFFKNQIPVVKFFMYCTADQCTLNTMLSFLNIFYNGLLVIQGYFFHTFFSFAEVKISLFIRDAMRMSWYTPHIKEQLQAIFLSLLFQHLLLRDKCTSNIMIA